MLIQFDVCTVARAVDLCLLLFVFTVDICCICGWFVFAVAFRLLSTCVCGCLSLLLTFVYLW